MMPRHKTQLESGFTLIEALVSIAVLVVMLSLGIPSFTRYIVDNRLKAVASQFVTDLQYARAEAAAKNQPVYFTYRLLSNVATCYTIYTSANNSGECNCLSGAGNACTAEGLTELKTVSVPWSDQVRLLAESGTYRSFAFDHITGGVFYGTVDYYTDPSADRRFQVFAIGDTSRTVRILVSPGGKPRMCSYGSTRFQDLPAC